MIFERIKSEGLAHLSYFVGSGNEAIVIDPRRDCQIYLDIARREGMKIKYIFETHRNEDYVIGSLELKELTDAEIYHGKGVDFKYGIFVSDEQEFNFGSMKLTALHTPGHTDESMSYALTDPDSGKAPLMVFTGDALFVGDVGRTDLYGPEEIPRMAANLYESIFSKILPLGDGVILCPAHGAGSLCGGAISKREYSTLGLERIQNPALQRTDKEKFIKFKLEEKLEFPPYFKKMEQYNLQGPPLLKGLPVPELLFPKEFVKEMEKGAMVVDTRMPHSFGGAHIKGSYGIWLKGLPYYAGWVLPYDKPILLVLEEKDQLEAAVSYLVRIGYDSIAGFLNGGISSWYMKALPVESLNLISVQSLKDKIEKNEEMVILDVRRDEEWEKGHIEGARHVYVGHLEENLDKVPRNSPIIVYCDSSRRSNIAASILKKNGYDMVYNVLGSMTAWKNAGYKVVK
ncbi:MULTISPECIES: MBL fold metallo-hydrolase [Methanosarcina]|jgi:hydroxyacylglutathione hydrolase|uniref:MBL fold metallo-hydrolase n=2 Tax=Methanosarcina mazei TaxID=2209 RepID=A0A0F8L3T6_METMZ|nr:MULTISPECIES: MBL fold metallo-hydrolase [Methanosarcina]AKB71227.1 Metallo-beta-lactamase family protein [Methanosarcina mazei C16]KKF99617.1 metallo-beta-lactamase [Methanosarcina mazei]KKG11614.1 metallo-beta-lactamase [Methanosarcina mazei]KKG31761.1 metallo-beta-lactamase [Methanosarcina mazei]KKG40004.1 metallo-beta-lactamase [Methanosarcina mazei]